MTEPRPQSQPGSATLTELADRCEKATGPDRELDVAIDVAVRGGPDANFPAWVYTNFPIWRARADGRVEVVHHDGTGGVHWTPKAYTASVDAAMTLVSDDHFIVHIHQQPSGWMVKIGDKIDDHKEWESEGNTLAGTLSAVNLRARAALEARP